MSGERTVARTWPSRWRVTVAFVGLILALGSGLGYSGDTILAPVTVTDALGRSVYFPKLPQRIVIAGRGMFMIADAIFLFSEAAHRVVAVEQAPRSDRGFLSLVDPTYGTKTILEPEAGAEQIAPSRPDVVLLKSAMADRLGQSLTRLGLPVVYVDLETPDQYTRDIGVLGQLVGNPDRARQICRYYEERLEFVQKLMAGLEDAQKPGVLLLQYSARGAHVGFTVPPASWIQTTLVSQAGGLPVWTDASKGGGWTVVGLEQISAWNPDQIYVVSYRSQVQDVIARLMTDPTWQALKAVQSRNLFGFPGDFYSWDQPDTRWPLGLLWLATRIHPERTRGVDLAGQVARFYAELYGLPPDVIRDTIMPSLKGSL
jgi:iron complex transport system substrate-binding protein